MVWLLLGLGFFLMVSGVLGQVYSLKTKRGVFPPKTRYLAAPRPGRRFFLRGCC